MLGPRAAFERLIAAGSFPELRLPPDEEFAFERFSGGRKVGDVAGESHYRSGSPESWRALPRPLIAYVVAHLGGTMGFYPEVAAELGSPAAR